MRKLTILERSKIDGLEEEALYLRSVIRKYKNESAARAKMSGWKERVQVIESEIETLYQRIAFGGV